MISIFPEVPWQPFSFHFKQVYNEEYRYLDKCGEFMIQAIKKLDFVAGEAQVIGAKLEKPELGIKKAACRLGEKYQAELEKAFGMVASHKQLDYHFAAGSYELSVNIQPVTFERVAVARFNPDFGASPRRRKWIDRQNKRADRVKAGVGHALMLLVDLVEHEPPAGSLSNHFGQLLKARSTANDVFKIT